MSRTYMYYLFQVLYRAPVTALMMITLIRPKLAPSLPRNYCELCIFKYIFKIKGKLVSLTDSHREKGNNQYVILHVEIFVQNTLLSKLQVVRVGFIT